MGQSEESQPLVGGSTSRPRGGGGFGVKSVAAVCAVMALYLLAPYLRPSAQLPGNTVKRILPAPSLTYRDENERLREQIAELQAKLKKRQEAKDEKEVAQMGAAAAAAAELQRQAQQPPQQAVASHPPETASHPPAASNASVGRAAYRLTRELIRSRCNAHNIILVTFVNFQRCDYGLTWSGHVVRLGLSNYLVGAMDGKALELLASKKVPTFDMESGLTTADYGWGTKNFRKLGLRKCELILSLLSAGADPIVTDADALITRDPTPFVMRLRPEAQVLVTSDHLMATDDAAAESLELPKRASSSAWNIGYFYLHHSALPAIAHWKRMCEEHPDLWDQNLFKDVFKIGRLRFETSGADAIPQAEVDKRLFRGYNGTVTIGILPVATFCGGHTYFVQRMPQRRGVVPYSVHTTFQYSGAVGKTHRLREAMLWADDAAYFDPPGRSFLTYVPVVRRELLRPAGVMGVAAHFEVVHHQLVQLRAAFLLAARLGRLLIVPPLTCGLDRFWAPHNGTIPGSDTRLPVEPCPLDHVLDLENGISKHALPDSRLARDPAGRPLGGLEGVLREFSFLNNSRTPDAVRQSLAFPDPPADLSAASLAPLAAATARVLHFARMPDLYATLPPADATRVRQEMMWYTTLWCCSKPAAPKTPGHIFYDMFFDVVPHTDKSRREWTEPWTPKFGP